MSVYPIDVIFHQKTLSRSKIGTDQPKVITFQKSLKCLKLPFLKRGQVFLSFAYLIRCLHSFFTRVPFAGMESWLRKSSFLLNYVEAKRSPVLLKFASSREKKTEPAVALALQACRVCWDLRLQSWVLPASLAPALASWQFRANIPWRAGSSALLSFALRSAAWRLANERH